MGCANEPNDHDEEMLDEARRGIECTLNPKLQEELSALTDSTTERVRAIETQIRDVLPPSTFELPDVNIEILPSTPPSSLDLTGIESRIGSFAPTDVVMIEKADGFVSLVSEEPHDRPPGVPKTLEASALAERIIPTKRNLQKMLDGKSPVDASGHLLELQAPRHPDLWGHRIELHHDRQSHEGPLIPLAAETHRGKGMHRLLHSRQGLGPDGHRELDEQREKYYEWLATSYLGPWKDFFA